jgi:hypothetical protein
VPARVSRVAGLCLAAISAGGAAPHALDAFLGDDRYHDAGRHRICPPPAEGCIEEESDEKYPCQIGAERRLLRVGGERPTAHAERHAPLGPREERHADQGEDRESHAGEALRRSLPKYEVPAGAVADVDRESEEANTDDSETAPFDAFPPGGVQIGMEAPKSRSPRCELNQAVRPKAEECHAPGSDTGREGHDDLQAYQAESQVGQPFPSADELCARDFHRQEYRCPRTKTAGRGRQEHFVQGRP